MEGIYSKDQILQDLLNMGFEKDQIENAFNKSSNKSVEAIIQWMDENPYDKTQQVNDQNVQESQQEGQKISSMVNQVFVSQIMEMGYSKQVAEKSVFLSQGLSVEKALNWIDEHKFDMDFEEELFIVHQEQNQQPVGPVLSKEEALEKARILQQQIREKKKKQEEEYKLEQEKNRIQSTKLMKEAQQEQEQLAIRLELQRQKKQKEEDARYKEQLLQQMKRDKQERFGKNYIEEEQQKEKEKTPFDLTAHPSNLFPGMAKTALSTILLYIQNISKNPSEEKFRKINVSNANFQSRVGQTFGGIAALQNLGFVENDGMLFMNNVDQNLLTKVIEYLSKELEKM